MIKIEIVNGDITKIPVDAIVNAANESLLGGGGVNGAIHRAAGPQLLAACRNLKGCETGHAKHTPAYDLPAKWVIHTVGPRYSPTTADEDEDSLSSCYQESIKLANELGAKSMSFPAISTGVFGYPLLDATRVAFRTCVVHPFNRKSTVQLKIVFVCFDKKTEAVYQREFENLTTKGT